MVRIRRVEKVLHKHQLYEFIYRDLAPFFALGQEDFKKRLNILVKNQFPALEVLKISSGKASGGQTGRVQSVSYKSLYDNLHS